MESSVCMSKRRYKVKPGLAISSPGFTYGKSVLWQVIGNHQLRAAGHRGIAAVKFEDIGN